MDRIIEVKVFGNHLTKDSKNAGTRGEANVTHLRISFDKGWDGYTKKITFWDARGLNPVAISLLPHLSENQNTYLVSIPPEPMKEAGMLTFVIEGTVADKIQRSLSAKLEVEDAPDTTGAGQSTPPTEDELTQLEGEIEKIKDDVLEVMDAREETRMLAEKVQENANKAEDAVGKTSYIGENGNWYSWDSASGAFYDTGIKASAGLSDEDMEKIKILVNSKEDQVNKKDVIDDSSDDAAYPSTKAVKNYVVTLLTNYYKKSETYGKDEVDKLLGDICSLVSESLSNYYTKQETQRFIDNQGFATQIYVDNEIRLINDTIGSTLGDIETLLGGI